MSAAVVGDAAIVVRRTSRRRSERSATAPGRFCSLASRASTREIRATSSLSCRNCADSLSLLRVVHPVLGERRERDRKRRGAIARPTARTAALRAGRVASAATRSICSTSSATIRRAPVLLDQAAQVRQRGGQRIVCNTLCLDRDHFDRTGMIEPAVASRRANQLARETRHPLARSPLRHPRHAGRDRRRSAPRAHLLCHNPPHAP